MMKIYKQKTKCIAIALMLLMLSNFIIAQTATTSADGAANAPATWGGSANSDVPDIFPPGTKTVTVVNINHNLTFGSNLTIPEGVTLNINPSGSFKFDPLFNPTINFGGALHIKSDATGTGSLILNYPTVTFISLNPLASVERYLPSADWHLISSPVNGIKIGDFATAYALASGTTLNFALGRYNTNDDTWTYTPTGAQNLWTAGAGYSIKPANGVSTLTFPGLFNAGGMGVSLSTAGNRWNLIGNPYTSAIVINNGVDGFLSDATPGIDNPGNLDPEYQGVYLWDQSIPDYVVVAKELFTFPGVTTAPGGETVITNQPNIALGQGFFVKAKAGATATVQFYPEYQIVANNTAFKSAKIIEPALRLTVQSGDLSNRTVVGFKSGLSAGLDPGYDVGKFKANSNLALYSRLMDGSSTVNFEVQGLPNVDYNTLSVPLGMNFKGGDAVFTLETNETFPKDVQVYIEDTQLNKRTLLNAVGAAYTVNLPVLTESNRFNLVMTGYKSGQISTSADVKKQADLFVYTRNRAIFVNGIADAKDVVAVYGVDGRLFHRKPAGATGLLQIDAGAYPAGIYMVSVEQKSGRVTRKVIISE